MLRDRIGMVAFVPLFLVASSIAVAGGRREQMTLEIESAEGESISVSISADFVGLLAEKLASGAMECEGTNEEDTRAMLEHLSRRGEGSKYTLAKADGEVIRARRKKGQLHLQIEKPDEKVTEVSMPWAVAECMLGHDVPVLRGDDRLALSVEQDGAIRIRIE